MNEKLHELVVVVKNGEGVPVVSSLEVADKFGKRHDHVLRDIDNLLKDATREVPNFGVLSYVAKNKAKARCYEMNRRGFSLLAMGFTGAAAMKWKSAFLDAFEAMEKELTRRQNPSSMTRLEILTMAIEAEKKVLALESRVEVMQPDVDAIERLRVTPGSVSLQIAAKDLKMNPLPFINWLHNIGWLHWRAHSKGRRSVAYQPILDKGWLCHGPAAYVDRSTGERERVSAVHVTNDGMVKLAKILNVQLEDARAEHEEERAMVNRLRHDDTVYGSGDD
jgi:Rha family phage regulatory protein